MSVDLFYRPIGATEAGNGYKEQLCVVCKERRLQSKRTEQTLRKDRMKYWNNRCCGVRERGRGRGEKWDRFSSVAGSLLALSLHAQSAKAFNCRVPGSVKRSDRDFRPFTRNCARVKRRALSVAPVDERFYLRHSEHRACLPPGPRRPHAAIHSAHPRVRLVRDGKRGEAPCPNH